MIMNNKLIMQVFLIEILGLDIDFILNVCKLINLNTSKRSIYRWLRAEQEMSEPFYFFIKMAFDYFNKKANQIFDSESHVVILPYYISQDEYARANQDLLSNIQIYNAFLKFLHILNEQQKQPKNIIFDTENVYANHDFFINPSLDFSHILTFFKQFLDNKE